MNYLLKDHSEIKQKIQNNFNLGYDNFITAEKHIKENMQKLQALLKAMSINKDHVHTAKNQLMNEQEFKDMQDVLSLGGKV